MADRDHTLFHGFATLMVLALAAASLGFGCQAPNLWAVEQGLGDGGAGTSDAGTGGGGGGGSGGGGGGGGTGDDFALPPCSEYVDDGAGEGEGADSGEACEVTEDCREPLICLEGACVAPGQEGAWCDGIDVMCPYDGSTCVGGLCVFVDGACSQNLDCPDGYLCVDGACGPATGDCVVDDDCPDGAICDFGSCVPVAECAITQDLRGTFAVSSIMHLGEAAGGFLQAMEWIRNLLLGEGHIPDTLELFDDLVLSVLNTYLVPWERDVIIALGDINDLLDEAVIEHTMTLDADCRDTYRGTITFDHVALEFRGDELSGTPEDIPMVGPIPTAEFGARLRCRSLSIDEFRVQHLMAGLLRWLADGITQSASRGEYMTVEDAMVAVIDCPRIAERIMAEYPTLGLGFEIACEIALSTAVEAVTDALANPVELDLMRLSGEATVPDSDRLTDGHWSGSFGIGDFSGEFAATRL